VDPRATYHQHSTLSGILFAAVHKSAYGTKRTRYSPLGMSAIGGKADMAIALQNVR
jgi:hypothetical protein